MTVYKAAAARLSLGVRQELYDVGVPEVPWLRGRDA